MRYTVTIDNKLAAAERKSAAAKLREAGLQTYRHFQGDERGAAAAQKYAALMEAKHGVRMEIAQTYSVGFSVF